MLTLVSLCLLLAAGLLLVAAAMANHLARKRKGVAKGLPGPGAWPVLGSLHLLGGHETPFHAFTALAKRYGQIYQMRLGASRCVVVNSFALIKEVLITKGAHFGGRPDFIRFHQLFGGDRDNSLALCDWSDLQKTRRRIARFYCSPRFASPQFSQLSAVAGSETARLLQRIRAHGPGALHVKPLIQATCANMFANYMCSMSFDYDDAGFQQVVQNFDEIFWDINQGYAVDFLPWLLPVYQGHMKQLQQWAHNIRQFILTRVVAAHRERMQQGGPASDFTDALLQHLESDPELTWQHAIFELEDFLGGHSAVGNLIMLTLAAVVKYPEVGAKIQAEIKKVAGDGRPINLFDRSVMPYTEATILETLRVTSSPIVPHVATEDSSISGYEIPKGTVVFLNNYELNTGEEYWKEPETFKPERFVVEDQVVKPSHFIPFSTGKRTCIGSKLVQSFTFAVVTSILQNFDISAGQGKIELPKACVALPPKTFSLVFTARQTIAQ
ncbi:cytochrome P450 307a1-like [Neocloeon triangulifer]|uniref:cytochrome P450 307a1-like n=1 Tax=Neocloeon triangulifer TaxID=2078957 RepID=UPI00286FABCD|nr:cytochrome P450 307a1-like [Neocloeon triangulifer]